MCPSTVQFRALARSSPWRFETLKFVLTRQTVAHRPFPQVRAWLRRPGLLRVEHLDGELVQVMRDDRRPVGRLTSNGRGGTYEQAWPHEVAPETDSDGLVRQRPNEAPDRSDRFGVGYDDPLFQSYDWVAMLDPWELADGSACGGDNDPPATQIDELRVVTHHHRDVWEAVLRPTASYDPRCSCCPLLRSPQSDAREAEAGGSTAHDHDPEFAYADAHRVRLDTETGVCVWTEELGGTAAGSGIDVAIETVDEPMPDELFDEHKGLLRRR